MDAWEIIIETYQFMEHSDTGYCDLLMNGWGSREEMVCYVATGDGLRMFLK